MVCHKRDDLLEIIHSRGERPDMQEEFYELLTVLDHAIKRLRAGQRAEALEGAGARKH